ncbi:MAG TPA: prepilin-type N-terminal cleavage/methylation domain-containing protein [Roseiarcus sp.]|nr:prepilin-type N-terminal cleavage/methylation domain-containing protein [Roseiarcus sp.]
MWQSAKPNEPRIEGFTLIEALAAIAVVATGLAAIGGLADSSLRSDLHTRRHLAQIFATREIIAGLPRRDALPFGYLSGVLNGHEWRIHSTLMQTTAAAGAAEWVPQGIALLVRSPYGSTIEIDTIRMRRRPTK